MIIDLDRQGWAWMAVAMKMLERWSRENGRTLPPDIAALAALAKKYDSVRQEPTDRAGSDELLDDEVVRRKLTHSLDEAADRIGVSKRTVERLVADGTLPSVRIVGARRIRVSDLEAYIESLPTAARSFRDDINRKQAS